MIPSNTVTNPKDVKAITLRSGTSLGEVAEKSDAEKQDAEAVETDESDVEEIPNHKNESVRKDNPDPQEEDAQVGKPFKFRFETGASGYEKGASARPKSSALVTPGKADKGKKKVTFDQVVEPTDLPFPAKLKETKLDREFQKFVDMFSQLYINIPVLDAITRIPS